MKKIYVFKETMQETIQLTNAMIQFKSTKTTAYNDVVIDFDVVT
jgi:hypothetical protein